MSGFIFPVLGHILTRGKLRDLNKEVLRGPRVEVVLVIAISKEVKEGEEKRRKKRRFNGRRRKNPGNLNARIYTVPDSYSSVR